MYLRSLKRQLTLKTQSWHDTRAAYQKLRPPPDLLASQVQHRNSPPHQSPSTYPHQANAPDTSTRRTVPQKRQRQPIMSADSTLPATYSPHSRQWHFSHSHTQGTHPPFPPHTHSISEVSQLTQLLPAGTILHQIGHPRTHISATRRREDEGMPQQLHPWRSRRWSRFIVRRPTYSRRIGGGS